MKKNIERKIVNFSKYDDGSRIFRYSPENAIWDYIPDENEFNAILHYIHDGFDQEEVFDEWDELEIACNVWKYFEHVTYLGLIQGRHDIPQIEDYVYPGDVNPLDTIGVERYAYDVLRSYKEKGTRCLVLYVTGLTVATIATINACKSLGLDIILMHYNMEEGCGYYPQYLK